jgi:putative ABC transport system substrate-binding protein
LRRRGAALRLGVASTQILKLYAPVYRETLRTLGYEEGRNYTIEYRFSDGDNTKLPALARELAANHPDLIVASSEPALVAVIDNGGGVPVVVFACDALPKLLGSIRRPGGNATGFSCVSADLVGKRMGLLKELVPGLSRVALLYSTDTEESEIFEAERVAKVLDVAVTRFAIHNPGEVDAAMNAIAVSNQQAVHIFTSVTTNFARARLAQLALDRRLPAIFGFKEFAEAGGLITYGADTADGFRRLAYFSDRILKGTKPADLPAEEPTRFHLAINRKTAAVLGIQIPQAILVQADQVIE